MNKALRQATKQRAKFLCEYCLCSEFFSPDPFEIDHIIPQVLNGVSSEDNLALACSGCNGHKSDASHAIDPATGILTALYHPRKDDWATHFRWDISFTIIIGISPIGRATVERIKLNRENIVNLRRVLVQVGEHPPF